jgi:hypothetical protein
MFVTARGIHILNLQAKDFTLTSAGQKERSNARW